MELSNNFGFYDFLGYSDTKDTGYSRYNDLLELNEEDNGRMGPIIDC